jgi:hypothetical protein
MRVAALPLCFVLAIGTAVELRTQLRDSWWADVPTAETDAITSLCRENGKPLSFREVRARYVKVVENRLRDTSIVAIDSEEALRLAGEPPNRGRWEAPHLVRALRFGEAGDGFTVFSCGRDLLVSYTAAPGDASYGKTVHSALVVELDSMPRRVFVTCGVGIR